MALERFIPKSPDMFIRNSQDFEVAKFGHLNTIVEYINNNSAKPAGLNGYVQFNDNTALGGDAGLFWDNVNKRLGVGTVTPLAPLNVYNSSASVSNLLLLEQDTSATIGQIINYRKNGSVNLTNGTEIGRLAFGGYFNSTYSPPSQTCSAIYGYYGGTGTDRVGGLRLVTWNGGGLTTRLQVAPDGKIGIGTTIATAKLEILGEGSTSATTALRVQNSAGNAALTVRDDLYVFGGSRVYSTGNMYMDGSIGLLFSAWGQLQLQGASYVQINNDTLRAGSQNFTFQNTSFSPNNVTNSNLRLVGNSAGFTNGGAGGTSVGNVLEIPIDIATSIGNVTLNHININGVVNTTAGTTLQRGFYYNPTLTGTVGFTHRAIETVTGDVLLATTSGRVGIGTSAPTEKLTIDSGNLLFTTTGNSEIYGLRNGVNQDTRIIINNQSTGGLHLGAKYGNPTGCIYFECGLGVYTERMRLTPNGSLLIGTTTETARLQVQGSGATSGTTSLLVQNSSNTQLLKVRDDNYIELSNTVYVRQSSPGGFAVNIQGGPWNGTVGLLVNSTANPIVAISNLGADASNPNGASIYAAGGAIAGLKSIGILSNRAIISSGNAYVMDDSAMLEVLSTTQGFLPPRMTNAQRLLIATPAVGLMVYCTDAVEGLYVYKSTGWTFVA